MQSDEWTLHEELLLEYEEAWQQGQPPRVSTYLRRLALPTAKQLDYAYLARELAKIDLEHRLKNGDRSARCESYLQELPELLGAENERLDLVTHEFVVRHDLGQPATDSELTRRFPDDAAKLRSLLRSQLLGREHSVAQAPRSTPLPRPGDWIKQYRLEEIVGSGGFAVVFRARDARLNRQVAIKLLRPIHSRPETQRRMRQEALATAALRHQNVVPIIEIDSFDGHDYIVSRYVDGPTLEQSLNEREYSISASVSILEGLADVLAEAHAHGIVHRDVKPANILMDGDQPRITDFGLAHLSDASVHLTSEGDVLGTPAYMPPEQATGNAWQADPRSDIYSLGVILYRLLTGDLPFHGNTVSIIQQVINKDPPPPRKLRSSIPFDLQTIVLKCLEKEPTDRYQTAQQLADDLRAFAAGHSIAAKPAGPASRLWKWSRRRPALAAMSVAAMLLLSVALGVGLQYGRTRELLAESSASAGKLAMQRGQLAAALTYFDQAIEQGHPDPNTLRLEKLDALVALRRFKDAESELALIRSATHASDHVAAKVLVWQAEMALSNGELTAEPLFQQALARGLEPADQAYAEAMLADTSPDCVDKLNAALLANRFHHRARRMLSLMLFSLARFDQAGESIRTGISLYPDDDDFRLLAALWHASRNQLDHSEREIAQTGLENQQRWLQFCEAIHFVCHQLVPQPDAAANWAQLAADFQADYLPLIQSRSWHFPPRIAQYFADFPTQLAAVQASIQPQPDAVSDGRWPVRSSDEPAQRLATTLQKLVQIHPEASLFLLLGGTESMLHYRVQEREAGWAELDLKVAQEAFQGSRDHPGFVAAKDQHMYDGLLGTTLMLWIGGQDVERSRQLFIDAARKLDPRFVQSAAECRALAIGALRTQQADIALRWTEHFLAKYPDNRDALWHRGVMHQRQGNWGSALQLARKLLQQNPDDSAALGMEQNCKRQIAQQLEPKPAVAANEHAAER